MAQSSWPFENIDTTETQFSQWARNIGEGVIAGKGLELETFADSTGMTVKVKSGQALVRGHYYSSSAEETLTVSTANPTNPRIDLVVARLDPAANSIVLALVAGTPAGSPVAPIPTQTEADVYELPIAEVYVGAGVVTITAGNVTDVRTIFTPGASGAGVVFSDIAPEDTDSIWFNIENGNAYLYYDGFWTSMSGPSLPGGGTTGQVLAKTSATDYATQWVDAGKILQVISTAKTDTFTTTSTSYTDVTGLTATITPSSATSKVLIMVQLAFGAGGSSGGINFGTFKLSGGNAANYTGASASARRSGVWGGTSNTDNANVMYSNSIVYLDSPATTSAVTYGVQVITRASGFVTINRSHLDSDNDYLSRGASSITVMEVAG